MSAHFNRMLFSEQQKKRTAKRQVWMAWVVVGTIVCTASHLVAFLIGDRMGFERGVATEKAQPKRIVHVNQTAPWMGLVECVRACRSKDRMEKVSQK